MENMKICKVAKMPPKSKLSSMIATLFVTLLISLGSRAGASGVFELELINFEQAQDLRSTVFKNDVEGAASNNQIEIANPTRPIQMAEHLRAPVSVLICLKEAFTSQLDGPCTFGNASIIIRDQSIRKTTSDNTQIVGSSLQRSAELQLPSSGSHMTNLVRIPFTFRWTKSFTIILTPEQINLDDRSVDRGVNHHHHQHHHSSRAHLQPRSFVRLSSEAPNSEVGPSNGTSTQISTLNSKAQDSPDRHVLTENEVVPNLESNQNKPWTHRFSRTLRSSLEYKFRVFCSVNYFGDGCSTFCRQRDDQFGHYNCSSTGQKICLDGWFGPDCDKAKCRTGCSQQYGYCDKPDTCQCRPGWAGPRCDECLVYPGCVNGYCLNSWQCICRRNWGGVLCDQELNYCDHHDPCLNSGSCQNVAPGRYKCHCPEGFTGVNCELQIKHLQPEDNLEAKISAGCALNPCLNGGTCFGFYSQELAAAPSTPTTADTSQSDEGGGQLEFPASLGAIPYPTYNQYRCQCEPGWTGDYCQWPELMNHSYALTGSSHTDKQNSAQPKLPDNDNQTVSASDSDKSSTIATFPGEDSNEITTLLIGLDVGKTQRIYNHHHPVNIPHLISGVMVASSIGVFLAFGIVVWCCFIAIKRNLFTFVQMNIIRAMDAEDPTGVQGSRFARMQRKIRDSLRLSSRIKSETKLSIDNVLQRPPSYEESNNITAYMNHKGMIFERSKPIQDSLNSKCYGEIALVSNAKASLVTQGALGQKLASSQGHRQSEPATIQETITSHEIEVTPAILKSMRHEVTQATVTNSIERDRLGSTVLPVSAEAGSEPGRLFASATRQREGLQRVYIDYWSVSKNGACGVDPRPSQDVSAGLVGSVYNKTCRSSHQSQSSDSSQLP